MWSSFPCESMAFPGRARYIIELLDLERLEPLANAYRCQGRQMGQRSFSPIRFTQSKFGFALSTAVDDHGRGTSKPKHISASEHPGPHPSYTDRRLSWIAGYHPSYTECPLQHHHQTLLVMPLDPIPATRIALCSTTTKPYW